MSKQRPDGVKIANELAGGSAFFRKASPSTEAPAAQRTGPQTPVEPSSLLPPAARAEPVRPGREVRRKMIRHPFELYWDQLDQLRARAEAQRHNGEPSSMSRMVRDAIDRFLNDAPTQP